MGKHPCGKAVGEDKPHYLHNGWVIASGHDFLQLSAGKDKNCLASKVVSCWCLSNVGGTHVSVSCFMVSLNLKTSDLRYR